MLKTPCGAPEGPASTITEATLGPAEAIVLPPLVPPPPPVVVPPPERRPSPPPQADRKMTWIKANKKILRTGSLIT
jgi:hypothetical protein